MCVCVCGGGGGGGVEWGGWVINSVIRARGRGPDFLSVMTQRGRERGQVMIF